MAETNLREETPSVGLMVTSLADWRVAGVLFGTLYLVYLFTASLTFISTDEYFLFDATESIARRGDIILSETADIHWPGEARLEPLQPFLGAILFKLATSSEKVGNAHVTLIFNALVTAVTVAGLFLYVLRLGYSRTVSTWVALLFGLTTIAWPYSQTYFREPLSGLTMLVAAYGFMRWRQAIQQQHPFPYRWLIVGAVGAVATVMTKEAGLLALPFFAFILLRGRMWSGLTWRRLWQAAVILLVIALLAIVILNWYTVTLQGGAGLWDVGGRIRAAIEHLGWLREGVPGYLFSPGKSLFWYSPLLLLALVAPWVVEEHRRADVVWPLAMLALFVFTYPLVRTYIWFGGTNWGARYMVPLTPFLMVSATPVISRAIEGKRAWIRGLVIGLAGLGLLVQIGAVAVNPLDYYRALDEAGEIPWQAGIWSVYHSAILWHWRLLGSGRADFAWAAALDAPDWLVGGVLAFGVLAGLTGVWWVARRNAPPTSLRAVLGLMAVMGVILVSATSFLVQRVYVDWRFQGDNQALHQLLVELENTSLPDPVIFLNNRTYFPFMLNYYKQDARWYTWQLNEHEMLPENGERPWPGDDPELYVNENNSWMTYFGAQHRTIFLVMETGPFDAHILRPTEWWLNATYFKLQEITLDDRLRLLAFTRNDAPPREQPSAHPINWQFGDSIRLVGYDSNPDPVDRLGGDSSGDQMTYRPGSVLTISTQWEVDAPPGEDLSIGTYLITPQGTLQAQFDSYPLGGFWPTSTWRPGDVIRHNVAFVLPEDLPPGFYEVWTRMYSPFTGERLPVTDATGTAIRDHVVLFTIEVTH